MNLVQLRLLDHDGSTLDEYLFHTEKERDFFCTFDHVINKSFIEWIKINKHNLYEKLCNYEIDIFYYHEDSIEKI